MIAELMDGQTADQIIVGVGPGSFTGIRVGIAAAHGLAIGWDAGLAGMSSLALLAAGVEDADDVAVAVTGGHGELFVQQFAAGEPVSELRNLAPAAAAAVTSTQLIIGSASRHLVDARGWGEAREAWPSAADALKLPATLRSLPARPVYARAPDAKTKEAA
jgi:tRNA threonylcarbamoyl adenosine modification protein YeaZ